MKNWRDRSACRNEDPELFFPKGDTGPWLLQIEQAKAVCRRCPVIEDCLRYAWAANPSDGIFGGLTEKERARLRRAVRRRRLNQGATEAKAKKAQESPKPRTLKDLVASKTRPLPGGHLGWTGAAQTWFGGQVYTPKQISFTADRGHRPAGRLRAGCGIDSCVLPAHLTEVPAIAECGTRAGYQKHLREKTEICPPCRQANTDADNRLRRTGTTKVAA